MELGHPHGISTNCLSVPAHHSQHQRAGPTHKFPLVPSPAQQGLGEEEEEEEVGGWQPCSPTPCAVSEKPYPKAAVGQQKGQEPSRGERGCNSTPPSLTAAGEEQDKKHHAPVILGGVDVPGGEDVQGQDVGVDE